MNKKPNDITQEDIEWLEPTEYEELKCPNCNELFDHVGTLNFFDKKTWKLFETKNSYALLKVKIQEELKYRKKVW